MSKIAESELIINERGAVYHLDVHPDEIADTIILVGDPGRVPIVSKFFDRIEHRSSRREFITHTGYVGQKRISVSSTGIGPDNIDICLNELDALLNIDFSSREIKPVLKKMNLVRFGTSGALQEELDVDSLVLSTHGLGLDNLMNYYSYTATQEDKEIAKAFAEQTGLDPSVAIPYVFEGSHKLLDAFGAEFKRGITVTCPGFYGPQGRILRLPLRSAGLIEKLSLFSHKNHRITNFEMETSAIYGLGKLMGHECLSVNVIIANRVKKEFSKDHEAAVEKMIQKALAVLSNID